MPGPVTYQVMSEFMTAQINRVMDAVEKVDHRIDQHDAYHRGLLEDQLRNSRTNVWQVIEKLTAFLSLVVAVVAVVLVATHGH